MKKYPILFFLLSLGCVFCYATEITVKNATELNAAISSAQPGDVIVLSNGVWTDVSINLNNAGTSDSPMTLKAETPGRVILNGSSSLTFASMYWIVEGLNFYRGALSGGQVIRFGSDYGRLTNSAVIDYNPTSATTQYYWVYFDGSHNRMDHCYLEGKNHAGPTVGNDATESRYNRFDSNYIGHIPYIPNVNGREIFRVWGYGGNEELGTDGAFFTIENNLFEQADGEGMEIISLKSNRNVVRYNTIKGSRGGITLRSGNYNTIQGNFILGQQAEGAYGIRVTGQYHTIINNYIADCPQYGINLYTGEYIDTYLTPSYVPIERSGTPLGRVPAYSQVRNCTIAFNTMVNISKLDLEVGGAYKSGWPTAQRVLLPEQNIISNNLIVKMNGSVSLSSPTLDTGAPLDIFTFQPNFYEGNIFYGGSNNLKPVPLTGFTTVNPLLSLASDGLYRLTEYSPAVNAASGSYPAVTEDMDGQMRPVSDVGADEFSTSEILRKPLSTQEAGTTWSYIPAPGNLMVTVVSGIRADLTWTDNSTDETAFRIERSFDGNFWEALDTVSADVTTFSDKIFNPGQSYYYRVMAFNENGVSAYSNVSCSDPSKMQTNILLNKSVTASNVYGSSYGGENAVDGSNSTRWATKGVTSATLEVDLGGIFTFSKVVTREYSGRVTSYKIQYWNGNEWLDAFTGTTIGTSDKTDDFTPVTGSKVRLNILAASSEPSIYEFAAYGYLTSGLDTPAGKSGIGLWCISGDPSMLRFHIPSPGKVTLSVFDLKGNEVEKLLDGSPYAGTGEHSWDTSRLAGGIYFVRISAGDDRKTLKVVVRH